MKLNDFLLWLDSFLNFEKTQTKNIFWLDTMNFLCQKLGNPQNSIPCIHIAGSKGKGSTANFISNVIASSGKKCGIYTSPHITDFRERISTPNGFFENQIYEKSADELFSCVKNIKKEELPGQRNITWFELVTVFAFLCFKNAKVDFAVYETGLGGRLDSTNVVSPILSVLMPIEKEHTEFLGNTIEEIASEKAGIIKPKTPCLVALQKYSQAENVFSDFAQKNDSEILFVKDKIVNLEYKIDSDFKTNVFCRLKIDNTEEDFNFSLKMPGEVQIYNAICAILAVKKSIPQITKSQIQTGLAASFLPGRFQILKSQKNITILDGAHTPNSIKNTIQTLKNVFPQKKYSLLFACAQDKKIEEIAPNFVNIFENIIVTTPGNVRKSDIQKVCTEFSKNNLTFQKSPDFKTAIQDAKNYSEKNNTILLVTGSFYLLAEFEKSIL